MKHSRAAVGTAIATSALTSLALFAAPAATADTTSETLATGLAGPLQLDVDDSGDTPRVVVAQSFAGLLSEVNEDGTLTTLFASPQTESGRPKQEVSGVAINGEDVAFLTTKNSRKKPGSFVKLVDGEGSVETIANLFDYEETNNPDADVTYGFKGLGKNCKKKLPGFVLPYKGIIESHPYGLANAVDGGWYVADAAANAIFEVSPEGDVSTVAALPSQDHVVTAKQAEAIGMPGCVAGKTFRFEAVPTDVEVDDAGQLVVSLLPGGPEDPSLGARGSVVRIDPLTGDITDLASGFAGATNVAVDGDSVFVSELFGSKISEIALDGTVSTFAEKKMPAAIEWADGKMYAAINPFGKNGGKLVALTPTNGT